jgi:hypothetical protein
MMTIRDLEKTLPFQAGGEYPYTIEGQRRLLDDARKTVLAITMANAEAVARADAALARGDLETARRELDSRRTILLGAAEQKMREAISWLLYYQES